MFDEVCLADVLPEHSPAKTLAVSSSGLVWLQLVEHLSAQHSLPTGPPSKCNTLNCAFLSGAPRNVPCQATSGRHPSLLLGPLAHYLPGLTGL